MSIATAIVPVPASGDGPMVDVSTMIGAKTFLLAGSFEGSYSLLASHDGVPDHFVPVLTLDSDGQEGVAQTPPEAYRYVRLRCSATALGPISAEISGVVNSDVNYFTTLAVLPTGTTGPQPAVDISALGLEANVNVICSGSLAGTIVVYGSVDGSSYNPMGTFQAGSGQKTLLGAQQRLEFSPLPTEDKILYVKVDVQGQILAPTTLTMGGTKPASSPGSTTTLSEAYDNGNSAPDQKLSLTNAHGGGVVIDARWASFSGTNALSIEAPSTNVYFPRLGGAQIGGGVVVGSGPSTPGEDDVAFAAGATATSQANTGRLGYHAGSEQMFMASMDGAAYVPLLVGPTATGFTQGSVPFGSATGQLAQDNANLFWDAANKRLGIDVTAAPTARLHVGASTIAAGTAPLKLDAGTLMSATEAGAVESDGTNLWWTDAGGVRHQLNNAASLLDTLAMSYAAGAGASDQTLSLLDSKGGGVIVDGTSGSYTGATSFQIKAPSSGQINFPRAGGLFVASSTSAAAAAGTSWNEVNLDASTLTLTGAPTTVTALSMARVGQAIINGAGNTVRDSYDLYVDAGPIGSATLSRRWSLGLGGNVQFNAGQAIYEQSISSMASPYPIASSDYALNVQSGGGAITIVLPSLAGGVTGNVPHGRVVVVKDAGYDAATNNITVQRGDAGDKIDNVSGSYVISTSAACVWLVADVVNKNWEIVASYSASSSAASTLAASYAAGAGASDQTMALLDSKGGGIIVDGTSGSFTGATSFQVMAPSSGLASFPSAGGLSVISNISVDAVSATWNEVNLQGSTLTLTGTPATIASLSMVYVGRGVIYGLGNVVDDAYDLFVDASPLDDPESRTATLTRSWSAGFADAVQIKYSGLVLGAGLEPPNESDLVVGGGATGVSELNTGRLGYHAGSEQKFVASLNGAAYRPVLTGPTATGFTEGSVAFGSTTGELIEDNLNLYWDQVAHGLGIDIALAPTARLHVGGSTAAAGTAPLKLDAGTLMSATEAGAVESDGTNLWWTDAGGARRQLNNASSTSGTLAATYAAGSVTSDQTLALLDSKGGGVIVDGTSGSFTGANSLQIKAPSSGQVNFPRAGGISVASSTSAAAAAGTSWNEVSLDASTLTLTGAPTTVTALSMARVGQAIIDGAGNTVRDSYDLYVDAGPIGSATLTRRWSLGLGGNVQFNAGQAIYEQSISSMASPYPVASSDYALNVQSGGGAITVVLPSLAGGVTGNVPHGRVVVVKDAGYDAATNNITVQRGDAGDKIDNVSGSYVINTSAACVWLVADVVNKNWEIVGSYAAASSAASTLTASYAAGAGASDQTLSLLDSKGGGVIVDGTSGSYTGATSFQIKAPSSGQVNFPRAGGFFVASSTSAAAAAGTSWNEVNLDASTLTLTGAPTTITALSMARVGQAIVDGAGNTVVDSYDLYVDAGPIGSATLTRQWSLGLGGSVQFNGGQTIHEISVAFMASPYAVVSSDYMLNVMSRGGAISIVLPSLAGGATGTVPHGRVIVVKDAGYDASTNNITVQRGDAGDKIENVSGSYVINTSAACVWLVADVVNKNWEIV